MNDFFNSLSNEKDLIEITSNHHFQYNMDSD